MWVLFVTGSANRKGETMQITVDRKALLAVLQNAKKIVPPHSTLPVLANVHLKVQSGLRVTATNLDVTYTDWITDIDTSGVEQWSTTVSLKQLHFLVKASKAEAATLKLKGEIFTVVLGKQTAQLVTIPTDEFPCTPSLPDSAVVFDAQTVIALADRTLFCVSTDETRPSLNGVKLTFSKNGIEACATDGHRLSVMNVPCESWKDLADTGIIIPPKALELASRFCKAEIRQVKKWKCKSRNVDFGFSDTLVGFQIGEAGVVARAFEGPYPNYRQIIPEDDDQTVMFDRVELTATLKSLAPHTDALTHQVRFEIRRKSAKLTVSVPDTGEVTEKVSCESVGASFAPKPFVVGYNVYYLLDCLKHLPESEEVQFALSTPKAAAILTTSKNGLMLLMPLDIK